MKFFIGALVAISCGFGLLFLSAQPQQTVSWKAGASVNGQCPVCGQMAPAWHDTEADTQAVTNWKSNPGVTFTFWQDDSVTHSVTVRFTVCKRCNAVFKQEAQ